MANRANDAATVMLTSGASGRIDALFDLRVLRSLWRLISAFFLIFLLPFHGRRRCMAMAPELAEKCGGGGGKEDKASAATGKVVRIPAAMVPRKSAVDKEVAVRRAMAVRRVAEDNGDEENKDVLRDYWLFVTSRGDTMFTQSWTPAKLQIRGVVVLLHGLNEHSGRYSDFAKKLNANGFKVYGMDWIGHGGSDGLHAYVPSLDYAVNDMVRAKQISHFGAGSRSESATTRRRHRIDFAAVGVHHPIQFFFVLHGTADSITDPEGSRKLHEEACSADKTIKLYQGLLHDLLFEPEKEEVTQSIITWLNDRL
ncbi:hypothetical protein DH2020_013526 [Rehmannia glutinosa]|uniref:Serine aminopeptidase S33 domain-containing protein n=1 Tax=Rehmannia glutinosa TaxID=99300 RepID=A0ABR0X2H7_REHGL